MDNHETSINNFIIVLIAIFWFVVGLALGVGTIVAESVEALLGGFGYFLVRNGWRILHIVGSIPMITGILLYAQGVLRRTPIRPYALLMVTGGAALVAISAIGAEGWFSPMY